MTCGLIRPVVGQLATADTLISGRGRLLITNHLTKPPVQTCPLPIPTIIVPFIYFLSYAGIVYIIVSTGFVNGRSRGGDDLLQVSRISGDMMR